MINMQPPSSVAELRSMLEGMTSLMGDALPEIGAFHEAVTVREVDGVRVTADVLVPKGAGPHPVLVYLHGGGWVAGSSKTHNLLAHRFCEGGYLVFNVDYRLAPEHPFPAPFDDAVAAIRWAAEVAGEYGGDASRLAVGGDSAGGNLTAAAVAHLADDPRAPEVKAVLLIYAALDFANMSAEVEGIDADAAAAMMELMVGSYLGQEDRAEKIADPRVSPIHVAEKLPPAHIVCGTADGLLKDAAQMADKLDAAGIRYERRDVPDMPHGFVQFEMLPQAREAIDAMLDFLGRELAA